MMRFFQLYLLTALFFMAFHDNLAYANEKESSVSIGMATRIIFHSDERKQSFPAKNQSGVPMVFHGLVLDQSQKTYSPFFIVNPEISHIKAGQIKNVQIVRIGGEFPEDRESLFYIQGHFLPSSDNTLIKGPSVKLTYALRMKMFYRPKKLKASFDAIDEVVDKLEFKVTHGKLEIKNLSPYYITIDTLESNIGTIAVPDQNSMIDPFGIVQLETKTEGMNWISWTLLNDGGFSTKKLKRKL